MSDIAVTQNFLRKIGFRDANDGANGTEEAEEDDLPPPLPMSDRDSIAELLNDTPEGSEGPSPPASPPASEDDTLKPFDHDQPSPTPVPGHEYTEEQTALLNRCLKLWLCYPDPMLKILSPANTDPPANGVTAADSPPPTPEFIATVIRVPKNPTVLKGGYLLVPSSDATRWIKRFVELRRPYMHVHNVTDGEEVAIVSLRNCRVDSQPGILGLLNGGGDYSNGQDGGDGLNGGGTYRPGHRRTASGRLISTIWTGTGLGGGGGGGMQKLSERLQQGVFAVYGTDNTWLFAAKSEREKMDWITKIDMSFLATSSAGGSGTASPQQFGVGGYPE